MPITRRRLITISAALAFLPASARATSQGTTRQWTGQALGARASIRLDHPDGEAIWKICSASTGRRAHCLV